ncbi:MAG: molecular chaperone HtpG [Thermoanaerobaculales bacterium]|nr:molecular chaperone HtpG [Thermoanaerobaculales bacterium]
MTPTTETFEFQAETSRLLHLVINSLYTTKDIFLRELISNSSDALDRLRFESVTDPSLVPEGHAYGIRVEPNPGNRTLTIHDNGIGMGREEVIRNLGTIAQSGTRELLQQAAANGDREVLSSLIGQFGVGFYSVFMVADKVSVITRRVGEENGTFWESVGEGRFDVSDANRENCGTSITLHLKPVDEEAGLHDYTDCRVLEGIVRRYSDFITHPVICPVERTEYERDDEGKIKPDVEPMKTIEDRTLNTMKPIWTRPQSEVKDEEYAEFYRHLSHDWTAPLKTIALRAEGRIEYRSLLFIPATPPLDFGLGASSWGLQLFAKSVMITENSEDVLPPWLRFVRGVVDSADLPLNVSREMLQQDRHITHIRQFLTSRLLKALDRMRADEKEDYLKFWRAFGRILKEGVTGENEYRERLQGLFLFPSSADAEKLTSLAEYVSRMKVDQDAIYFLTGDSRAVIENSPHLEAFKARGIEVLFLDDPVDEILVQFVTEYDGKALKSAAKGAVELGGETEKEEIRKDLEEKTEGLKTLLETLQKHIDEHVKEVRLSSRLTSSPACLVGGEFDMSPQLERLLRQTRQEVPQSKRILELNPEHEILVKLVARFEADTEDVIIAEAADLLYGYALLAEGSELPDPARFSSLLAALMAAKY